jgi:hypothetical protein
MVAEVMGHQVCPVWVSSSVADPDPDPSDPYVFWAFRIRIRIH